jgi:hypothetical protein
MADIDGVNPAVPPSGEGCLECVAGAGAGWWFHLRRCAQCGHVGCCDSSPSQHARAHYTATGHRLIQSYEPGEDWFWDFGGNDFVQGSTLAPPRQHPDDQPVPGPAGAVPTDWMRHLH